LAFFPIGDPSHLLRRKNGVGLLGAWSPAIPVRRRRRTTTTTMTMTVSLLPSHLSEDHGTELNGIKEHYHHNYHFILTT